VVGTVMSNVAWKLPARHRHSLRAHPGGRQAHARELPSAVERGRRGLRTHHPEAHRPLRRRHGHRLGRAARAPAPAGSRTLVLALPALAPAPGQPSGPGPATGLGLPAAARGHRPPGGRHGTGLRIVVRWSGTEPKLRLMVEAKELDLMNTALTELESAARSDLGWTETRQNLLSFIYHSSPPGVPSAHPSWCEHRSRCHHSAGPRWS